MKFNRIHASNALFFLTLFASPYFGMVVLGRLSDDVVIADQEVSKVYESALATMGVTISYKIKNPIPHVVENRLPPGKVKFFRYDSFLCISV